MDHTVIETTRPRFRLSLETQTIYKILRTAQEEEVITYETLSKAIGADVQKVCSHALRSASRICTRDDRMNFSCVRNVGVKRLTNPEGVHATAETLTRIRKATRRVRDRLHAVDYDILSEEDKKLHNSYLMATAVVESFSKPKTIRRLTAVNAVDGPLPLGRTLEFFLGKSA